MQRNHGSRRKRTDRAASASAIVDAALAVFLRKGYRETTTDEIAALAGVSKQTIYRNFPDKKTLFNTLILGSIDRAQTFLRDMAPRLDDVLDVRAALQGVALQYLDTVFQPQVLQLRRLLISEAQRFPELALSYYREVPERTLAALAKSLQGLAKRDLIRAKDPRTAARHFAALLLMLPLDRAMFGGSTSRAQLEREAFEGIDAFLAAYGTQTESSRTP